MPRLPQGGGRAIGRAGWTHVASADDGRDAGGSLEEASIVNTGNSRKLALE